MPDTSDLTVVCSYTSAKWFRRGVRAMNSIQRYMPGVRCCGHKYWGSLECRMFGMTKAETPWILFIDADVLATGDVRPLIEEHSSSRLIARRSPLPEQPGWHADRYQELFDSGQYRRDDDGEEDTYYSGRYHDNDDLVYRSVVWSGAFLIERDLAEEIVYRLSYWRKWYRGYRPRIFDGPLRRHDQFALTLALAEAYCLDTDTSGVGPEAFSWHSRPGEFGLIHHFGRQAYEKLERKGRLEAAIEERRASSPSATCSEPPERRAKDA